MSKNHFRHRAEQDKEPLHYRECGLDDIYLLSGYDVVETPYGEGVSIRDVDQLHSAIGCYLATQKKVLTGKELRFIRKQMDLTQSELGTLVGLNYQQVARWEKGQYQIPDSAELLMRVLFVEHSGGKINVRDLLKDLEQQDAPLNDEMVFENTSGRWKKAA